jgi:hypothetical protein
MSAPDLVVATLVLVGIPSGEVVASASAAADCVRRLLSRNSLQLGPVSIQSSPFFDIAPLNTKKFSEGILEPVKLPLVHYYLQRGVDANIILNLFIVRIDVIDVAKGSSGLTYRLTDTIGVSKDKYRACPEAGGNDEVACSERWDLLRNVLATWAGGADIHLPAKVNVFSQPTPGRPAPQGRAGAISIFTQASAPPKTEEHSVFCVVAEGTPPRYMAVGVAGSSVVGGAAAPQLSLPFSMIC